MMPYLLPENYAKNVLVDSNENNLADVNGNGLYTSEDYTSFEAKDLRFVLPDAISCTITQVLNGEYELEMEYPADGVNFDRLKANAIIVAKNGGFSDGEQYQPFRVYSVSKNIDGTSTINARHLAYDLRGVVVSPFKAKTEQGAISGIKNFATSHFPFLFSSASNKSGLFSVPVPTSAWDLMGGTEGSLLDVYGGEYFFNWNNIYLADRIGHDRNIIVEYGSNLTDFEQEENIANCYTGVVGYWQGNMDYVQGLVVSSAIQHNHTKILAADLTERFEERPSVAEVTEATRQYVANNNIGVPDVSWTIDFVPLESTLEYSYLFNNIGGVHLGDSIIVRFAEYGINVRARATSITWDVLMDRIVSVSLGNVKQNIASTVAKQQKSLVNVKQIAKQAVPISDIVRRIDYGNQP